MTETASGSERPGLNNFKFVMKRKKHRVSRSTLMWCAASVGMLVTSCLQFILLPKDPQWTVHNLVGNATNNLSPSTLQKSDFQEALSNELLANRSFRLGSNATTVALRRGAQITEPDTAQVFPRQIPAILGEKQEIQVSKTAGALHTIGILPRIKLGRSKSNENDANSTSFRPFSGPKRTGCALLFFGLPRSFELLVLPSIVKNILIPNKQNRCDILFHFYLVQTEKKSRSGMGGTIDPVEVLKLKDALRQVYADRPSDMPLISFINDTESDFIRKRGAQLEKYRKTKGTDGHFLYYPWMAKSYTYPTSIENIVKQWHSIQSVWEEMDRIAGQHQWNYSRIAMLRNDVVYVTPFDIYKRGIDTPVDDNNTDVIVPNWARFPINDRMIYGPYGAVKIWATERFQRLETHVLTYEPGYGMHSERFLNHSIFPAIVERGYGVVADPDICFFRTRVDGSAWINDCATRNGAAKGFRNKINTQALVEAIVQKKCRKSKFNKKITQLHCAPDGYDNITSS